MRTKIVPLQIKTVPTDGSGEFTGLASTFGGEPDFQGDVVEYGAFAESIIRWKQLGDFPPVGLNHDYNTASSRIGKLTSMLEIPEGLLVSGQLHLKSEAAMAAYEAMLTGALDALSIGYGVIEQHKRADGVNVLTKLDLLEVSLTPVPANPRARVLQVKSASAFAPAQMTEDGHRIRCTNCGKFSAIPMHPVSVFSGDRVFIGTCTGCGALQGYSPKSWSPSKNAAALREVRGRAVWSILTALRDGGAPAGVFKAAMSSARYCLDDPDGYTVKEFAARVNDLIDAAVDDEAVQREALVDRNVKAMLDDVEAALNVRGSKPWRIEARDGKFCVLLEADGSVEKCFPTRQEAEQYMRALYANATEGEKRHEPPAHLEALEALEGVDSKAEKHRLLSTMNAAGVIIHLRDTVECRVDGSTITGTVVGIRESGVLVAVGEERYLVQPNDVLSAVSDAPKALSPQAQKMLAEYDAGEARTKVVADREREEHKRFLQANEALLGGKIDWIAEDERDRERQARDLEAIERRAAEREQERAQADAADAARRDRGWHAGNADYYTEVIGGTPAPRQERTYREPNVIDATVGDLGDSFQIPTMPTERTDFGLPVPEAPLPEATVEPETFSGVPAFTVTPQAVPLTVDEEHFSVPMLSRELPTTVGTEPSVPSTPTTGGETVRLSTAGEVTNDVRTVTANEGETVRIPKASKPDGSRTVEK